MSKPIVLSTNEWDTSAIKFMPPKVNDRGGMSINIISTQTNRSLHISTPMIFHEPSVFMRPLTTGSSVSIRESSRPRWHPSVESRSLVSVARVGHTGSKSF